MGPGGEIGRRTTLRWWRPKGCAGSNPVSGTKTPTFIVGAFFMVFHVYILYSESFDKYYVGQTANLQDRVLRHNSGTEKATKAYRPWLLRWHTENPSRSEAMELERKLKNLSKERIISFIQKYS